MAVTKATIKDASQIQKLVNYFAEKDEMLARPLSEIYENIRDYFVVKEGDEVVACGALHVNWADLAEIKSLAIKESWQRKGLGEAIVNACLDEAKELDIPTIFCLTYKPAFFEKCRFTRVDKSQLPQKVWGECYRCHLFPNCDEQALILHLEKKAAV